MRSDRQLSYNMFVMNTPSHLGPGLWRHPDSRALEFNDLQFWVDLAKLAERGKMDTIFWADVFGLYGDFRGSWKGIPEHAVQFPINDPTTLVSALALATEHLGFVFTNSIIQSHPFPFARMISSLDHLTKGRVGWNIVTNASKNGARSMGQEDVVAHDERYRWADEYIDVTYKLWEQSWEDGAVIRDIETGRYADPSRVHKINHVGERYKVEGPHLVEPSPQRTPVLFQAGASAAGQAFAAKHAEGVFMISGSPEAAGAKVNQIRELAATHGRNQQDLRFFEGVTFITGSTDEEAKRKEAELEQYQDVTALQIIMNGSSGVDLSGTDPDAPAKDLIELVPGMRGAIHLCIDSIRGREATVGDFLTMSNRTWRTVGSPETIADKIEEYANHGVDGFNMINMALPGDYVDFVDHVAPLLQRRGLMRTEYTPGTLREKLFPGNGPFLQPPHPGAAYRASLPANA
jgi:FMN-dependent oxidoreductase (nitrilotriacetate monooxygenase family)